MSEDETTQGQTVEGPPSQQPRGRRAIRSPLVSNVEPSSYIEIRFQEGPVREVGVNGCQIEDVVDVLVARLQEFQRGPFQCGENEQAIQDLLAAKQRLLVRTARRQKQGVEGTNQPHVSAD